MRPTKIVPMVEGGVLAAVSIIFALISVYVPVLGTFVNLIWPVPIILLGVRHGYKWSILSTVVAGMIISILMHPMQAVGVVVGFGLIGIVLGHAFRSGFSPLKAMVWGSIASLISKGAVIIIVTAVMGFNPVHTQTEAMSGAIGQVVEIYRSFGMNEVDLAKLAESLKAMIGMIKIILPAAFGIASVFDTYINFLVAKAVLKKLGHTIEPFPPFKSWNLPQYILGVYGLSLLAVTWLHNQPETMLYKAAVNLQVLAVVALLVQGLALFYYFTDKYNLSKIVKSIILFLIFTNGLFSQALIFAGVFDLVFDYRKLRSKP